MGGEILDFLANILILAMIGIWAIVTCILVFVFGVIFLPFIFTLWGFDYIKDILNIIKKYK